MPYAFLNKKVFSCLLKTDSVRLMSRSPRGSEFQKAGPETANILEPYPRLRWFGHVECKSRDDWVLACRNVVVAGVRCAGRGRKTWKECVKDDMIELGLHPEWAVFRDMWRGFISGKTSNPS